MTQSPAQPAAALSVGFIGAGSFARNVLLPALTEHEDVRRAALASAGGVRAREVAEKFGFEMVSTSAAEILAQPDINTVLIATPHSTHGVLVRQALEAGKHVFVEKPLCIRADELESIVEAHRRAGRILMTGFNRRFSPFALQAREVLGTRIAPLSFDYRVNAGPLPPGHWLSRPEEGGRIIGEVCHFIDLVAFLAGSLPARVYALGSAQGDVQIDLALEDGSAGVIRYLTTNHAPLSKERLEIYAPDVVIEMDDFLSAVVHSHGRRQRWKWGRQDKGHQAEVAAFLQAARQGGPEPIAFGDMVRVTQATFAAMRSLETGQPVSCL